MSACARCRDGVDHSFDHGLRGYLDHFCRCDICRKASREYQQKRRKRLREESDLVLKERSYQRSYTSSGCWKATPSQRARTKAQNEATKHGPWSCIEDEIVLDTSITALEAAIIMKRTPRAVEQRRVVLRKKGMLL